MASNFPTWFQIDAVRSVECGWRQAQEESRSWLPLRDKCLGLDLAGTHISGGVQQLHAIWWSRSKQLCSLHWLKRFGDAAGLRWAKGCWKVRYLANPGGLERPWQPWPGIFILPKSIFFGLQSIKNAFSHSDFRVIAETLHSQVCDYTRLTLHRDWEVRWIHSLSLSLMVAKWKHFHGNLVKKRMREAVILDSCYRFLSSNYRVTL